MADLSNVSQLLRRDFTFSFIAASTRRPNDDAMPYWVKIGYGLYTSKRQLVNRTNRLTKQSSIGEFESRKIGC